MKESSLYPPVAKFLVKKYACDPRATWVAGCGKDLTFPSGFRKSKPDVVTVHREGDTSEVHLVEAKLLHIRAFAFDETRNQLDNHRRYADKLWAAFPESQWQDVAANHGRWKRELGDRGFGLLLVNSGKVRIELEPGSNPKMEPACKDELLEALLVPQDKAISVPSLGTDMGNAACVAAARVAELMAGPVKELLAPKGRVGPFLALDYDSEVDWFVMGEFEKGLLSVNGDPFGRILGDGRPVIWVWRCLGELKTNESTIRKETVKEHPVDTYFFAQDEDGGDYQCGRLSELDIQALKANDFVGEFSLGGTIPVDERTKAAVKKDLKGILSWTKQLGGKG